MRDLHGDWPVLSALLDEALALPAGERSAWLAALSGERVVLRETLARLLETAPGVETNELLDALPRFGPPAEAAYASLAAPAPGDSVGPYRLLSELGRGGMGTVWLAERADAQPRRRIALKLPHLGWAPGLAVRLARERDILASLEHQNIARLYDAGIDPLGRPYLALEYVDGVPIDRYCQSHALPLRARLDLVLQVAAAVGHAHTRLVVHRDLKPSNILVTESGEVRLLDFGIARLVDPLSSEEGGESHLTQAAGRALTPDYASPEQIRGDAIGTASDVYSLGVVLFELLAGKRPYRLKTSLGPVALAEAIAATETPRASVAAGDAALARQLEGDLDAIAARALAKASAERYATIDAFADDLERHLRGEPVRARPDTRWYRAERWVSRHKVETAIALAVLLAALGGAYAQVLVLLALATGATAAFWQRGRALRQAEHARTALARAEQVKTFIASIFTQAVPRAGHGGAVTAADLLRAAARRVEADLAGQAAVAAELSALIGASFNELGEMRAGLDWLPKAVERCARALGPTHPLTLQSRWRLVEAANSLGELSVSEPLLAALLRDLRGVRPPEPGLWVSALRSQAFVQAKRGHEAAAMAALNEAIEVATLHLGEASEEALSGRAALSNTLSHFTRYAAALQAIEPALAPAQTMFGTRRPHLTLLTVERNHGDALARNDRPRDAAGILRQVLADQLALDVDETTRVRISITMLANALLLGAHLDEAEALLEQAAAMHERLTGGINDESIGLFRRLSLICALRGDGAGALRQIARADAMAESCGGNEATVLALDRASVRTLAQATTAQVEQALAGADAIEAYREWLPAQARVRAQRARALALRCAGSTASACAAAEQALESVAAGGCPALEHGLALAEAARCNLTVGATAQAEQQFRAALAVWETGQVDGPAVLQPVQVELAALQTR